MQFLRRLKLIQGGMGAYVSTWRLARAVAIERPGIVAGAVSGTGLDVILVRFLQIGDPGGYFRRALAALDAQYGIEIGKRILDRYYIEGGKALTDRYTRNPNYLGEIMLYFAYAFMARHWLSWLIFAFMTVYFLARMTRKDHSISRHPGWAAYKEQSGLVIPWALLNGRAWKDLFGKPGAESDAGPSGLGGEAR